MLCWLVFFWTALAVEPNSHTTSPCGGCRSLFFDRQRKLTKRKPPCREQSNKAYVGRWLRRTARSVGWPLPYRLTGHRNFMTKWSRGGAPDRFARCAFGHLPFAVRSATILPALVVSWFCLWRRAPGHLMPCRTGASGTLLHPPLVSWWAPWPVCRAVHSPTTLVLRDKTTKPATPETAQHFAPRTADVGTVTAHEVRGRTT